MMNDSSILKMPDGFLWGVATAAYQNEGDNNNNQWATWEQQPGRIFGGQRCGSANRWWDLEIAAADFDRAAELGLNTFRLSVEWSRIEPHEGVFDEGALQHYCEMIDLLLERGLKPLVSLHHFTDPLWLTAQGAWENPRSVELFARFVTRVVEALATRVNFWCTVNEPMVYAYSGYLNGHFPPGVKSLPRALRVMRQLLLAHGRAYRVIHRLQGEAMVGLAHNLQVMLPANPHSGADLRATALINQVANQAVLEAVTSGRLVAFLGLWEQVGHLIDSSDYIGLNYYSTSRVAFDLRHPGTLFSRVFYDPQGELSEMTFVGQPYGEINPHGLYLALQQVGQYGKPVYITENGVPDRSDRIRPRFLATHLAEAWRAVREGVVDLRGYYHWTLVDNFEWCEAWNMRFGLFEMDRDTGIRTPKDSAAVYSRIVQANGVPKSVIARLAPDKLAAYSAE